MNKLEMVERYIYAVTQKLPQEQRKDIATELRGLILDMLEQRGKKENVKESDIEEVLLELGHPRELADQYRGSKKYLIGPDLYDSYIYLLKIVLSIVSISIAISFIIKSVLHPMNILEHFVDMILSIVLTLPATFGWLTFVFALGELFGAKTNINQNWKPSDLPPIPNTKNLTS